MRGRTARIAWTIAVLVALVAAFAVLMRTARPSMSTLMAIDIRWPLLVAASVLWYASFALLTHGWARSLEWWHQRLGLGGALHIFFLSNLARYIPGAVWQFAGLAAMSAERRVSPLAATAGVLIQQVVLLLTGGVIALVAAPRLLGGWTESIHPAILVGAAVGGLASLVVALPGILRRMQPILERRLGGRLTLPVVSKRLLAGYVARCVVAWVGYGVAFWLLARALFGEAGPSPFDASTAFIGAAVLGIAAVFAPGGIIVREVAMAGALAPSIGLERATLLAIASRVWMIALEILGALVMLALAGQQQASRARRRTGSATPE